MQRMIPVWPVVVALWAIAVLPAADGMAGTEAPVVRTVFLDPGHGDTDGGAVHRDARGEVVLREKDVNLAVALKTAELLRAGGYRVVLSRENDERPGRGQDVNGDGRLNRRDRLQAVVDLANASGADLFLSLHSNSAPDTTASGVEVYYCDEREFAGENRRLAELVQSHLLQALQEDGYQAVGRGVKDDSVLYRRRRWQGHLFVLGPARTGERWRVHPRATTMPGALGEALFVTNEAEAKLLASEEGQWTLARGYAAAVDSYFSINAGSRP